MTSLWQDKLHLNLFYHFWNAKSVRTMEAAPLGPGAQNWYFHLIPKCFWDKNRFGHLAGAEA